MPKLDVDSTSSEYSFDELIKKRRVAMSVREHSKNQREKRKFSLTYYERMARQLSDEHQTIRSRIDQKIEDTNSKRLCYDNTLNQFLQFM